MVTGRLSLLAASELDLGPHAERYRRWCTLYRYLFGELPRVVPVGGVDPKDGAPLRAFVCEHALFRDHIALGATRTWEHSAKLMGHLHGLGYQAWGCRCFNQVPTVETYMTLHRRFVGADYGFDLEFSELARHRLTFFEWLQRCFECVFVVHLTTADFYDALDLIEPSGPRFETDVRLVPHVIEVVHDLSQHIPNYHYYPKELLRRFADRIRDAMSDAVFEDALRNKPGPIAGFYDNDINAYAYQVWARIDDPGDFPNLACEPRNLRQIFAVLDKRIAETAEIGRSRGAQRGRFQLVDAKQRPRVVEPPLRIVPPPVARGEDASRAAAPFLQEPVRRAPDASEREPGAQLRHVQWTDAMSVGDATLDGEHYAWIDILAELQHAAREGAGDAALAKTFERLAAYTAVHFRHEEDFMRASGFEELAEHEELHRRFERRLADLRARLGEGHLSLEVVDTLVGWLVTHIEVVDRRYARSPPRR